MSDANDRQAVNLRRAAIAALESLGLAGISHIPAVEPAMVSSNVASPTTPSPNVTASETSPPAAGSARPTSATSASSQPPSSLSPAPSDMPKLSLAKRREALTILAQEVAGCTLCDELASTRTQTVFGVGNPQARLCFMGEAPGADEDRQGEPFVGRAGQLLTKIIEACTLRREDVYILNTLKCRPPGNRNPADEEAANCRQYLDRQLEIIQPEYICCLGAIAAKSLLGTTESIGRMRGKFHAGPACVPKAKVICTYHPAYLLRNPAAKRDVWNDMQMLMAEMGIKLPKT